MKTAFISDIHGNFEALSAVLARIDGLDVDGVVCLGDVAGYYSQINECCDALRSREVPSLLGNHDWYLGGRGHCARSRSVNDCLAYQRRVVRPDNLDWLASFQLQARVGDVRAVHGGWSDPIDEYLEPTAEYFAPLEGHAFASGHTHVQQLHDFDGTTYCNPGSVGQPRDGDPRAAFATYDGSSFELHRVEYDIEKVCDLMRRAGFNDYYYGGLLTGASKLTRPVN